MDRLSIVLTFMSGALITGAGLITVFSLGYYNAYAVALCAVLGVSLAWPSAFLVSRRIKRQDREWDHTRLDRRADLRRNAPEV